MSDPPTPTHEEMRGLAETLGGFGFIGATQTLVAYVNSSESTAAELLKAQQRESEVRRNLCEALGYPLDNPATAFNMVDVLRGEMLKARERIAELERSLDMVRSAEERGVI